MLKPIKLLLLTLLFISSHIAIYASCKLLSIGEARHINNKTSDVVFLGIPIEIEDNSCDFIVIEEYKGSYDNCYFVFF